MKEAVANKAAGAGAWMYAPGGGASSDGTGGGAGLIDRLIYYSLTT